MKNDKWKWKTLAVHAIEGNQPAFFKNPVYLLVGPLWLVRRVGSVFGLSKVQK